MSFVIGSEVSPVYRCKILWIDRRNLLDLVKGKVRITDLPDDVVVGAMDYSVEHDAIGIRLHSEQFKEVSLGALPEPFDYRFEDVPQIQERPT